MQQLLNIIATAQQSNGSFTALTSSNPSNFSDDQFYASPFFTGLIVHALAPSHNHPQFGTQIKNITTQAAHYLLHQKSQQWTFNYWDHQSPQTKTNPYPDDLDDTFSSLSAIKLTLPDQLNGEALGLITKVLTTLEIKPGGPYRTWLVPSSAPEIWQDIDVAVNAQVAYFLHLFDLDLPRLEQYFINEITANKISSPYYPSPYPIFYYLSRICPKSATDALKRQVLATIKNLSDDDQLNRALVILSLQNLESDIETVKQHQTMLRAACESPIKAQAFCLDPVKDGKQFYAGANSLTAALTLAALLDKEGNHQNNATQTTTAANHIEKQIQASFSKRISTLDKSFKDRMIQAKDRILVLEASHHVTSLPQLFYNTLDSSLQSKIIDHQQLINQLGLANLYGWITYTLCDDIVDGERDNSALPVATFALREMLNQFMSLPHIQSDFTQKLHDTLDEMEAANYWEASFARVIADNAEQLLDAAVLRYPNNHYMNRSLGHTLTPIALLSAAGLSMDSTEIKSWQQFFHHHLAARQLNDDAHDWLIDLKSGRLNPINIALLREYKKRKLNKSPRLTILYQELEKIFWHHELVETSQKILDHVTQAKTILATCDFIIDKIPFYNLLSQPEQAALQALSQQKNATGFLSAYYGDSSSPRR